MEYLDNVLLKLKRKYSKDETVAALTKKLKEVEIENGKLSAEIAYLEHEAKENVDSKEIMKLAKIEARKEKLYLLKLNEINKKESFIDAYMFSNSESVRTGIIFLIRGAWIPVMTLNKSFRWR